jgi:hypothetical protein
MNHSHWLQLAATSYAMIVTLGVAQSADVSAATADVQATVSGQAAPLQSASSASVPPLDGIIMSAGRAMVTRNGESSPLEKEMTFGNGMRVRPDGSMTSPDGVSQTLGNDQRLKFDGELTKWNAAASASPAGVGGSGGTVTVGGTDGVDKASADLGESEAQRRNDAAVGKATDSDPKGTAK